MKKAYLHICHIRADGSRDTFQTVETEAKEEPLRWQLLGLTYTASGYGAAIPSRYMVRFNGRWRRVYVKVYSNSGTLYLKTAPDESITVQIEED